MSCSRITMLFAGALLSAATPDATASEQKAANTVVFVCEHGTVKSVIAMQLFNKLAAEQGSRLRAWFR